MAFPNSHPLDPEHPTTPRTGRKQTAFERKPALMQVYVLQRICFLAGCNEELPFAERVLAMRQWKEFEILRRLILGKPSSVAPVVPKSNKIKMPIDVKPMDFDEEKIA